MDVSLGLHWSAHMSWGLIVLLAVVLQWWEYTMDRARQWCLLDGVLRKCHLTELVFCVEYSKFTEEDLSHQQFCHGGEQWHTFPCHLSLWWKHENKCRLWGWRQCCSVCRLKKVTLPEVALLVCSHSSYCVETRGCGMQSEILLMRAFSCVLAWLFSAAEALWPCECEGWHPAGETDWLRIGRWQDYSFQFSTDLKLTILLQLVVPFEEI